MRAALAMIALRRHGAAVAMLHRDGATPAVARAFVTTRKAYEYLGMHAMAARVAETAHVIRTLI